MKNIKSYNNFILENFENYKYDVIRIHIEDDPEFSRIIQELCFPKGLKWFDGDTEYFDVSIKDYCIDISLKEKFLYLNPTLKSEVGRITLKYYQEKGLTVDPKIYEKEDLILIKNILDFGLSQPLYKPKTIKRDI